MKHLPMKFSFEHDNVLKVVYLGTSDAPEPYFSTLSIEEFLGSANASSSASSRMKGLENRIINYNQQFGTTFVSHDVVLLGSSKSARLYLSDGTYKILSVKSSSSPRARSSYYYNLASLFYVITTARTDRANVLQHWINGEVLPSIHTYGEYIATRKDGIGVRKQLTDAIKSKIDANELGNNAYMSITDAIYLIRYGMHTPQLRAHLGLSDADNIREHLSQDELQALARLESELAGVLNMGLTIDNALSNPNFIKVHRKPL